MRDVPGWAGIVRRMIKVFWDDEVDTDNEANAASQFCGESWENCRVAVGRQDDAETWRKVWRMPPRQQPPIARRPPRSRRPEPDLPEESGEPVRVPDWDELRKRANEIKKGLSR
jgi:hypothetical protein